MKLQEIIQLKNSLGARLNTLHNELGLTENDHQVAELTEFRSRTGLWKLIYYFNNKARIRAGAEFEALLKLQDELPNTQGLDPSLDHFGTPENSPSPYEKLLNDCTAEIAGRQTLDKNEYWKTLYLTLNESKIPGAPLLAAYIKNRKDLPLCEPEITLKKPQDLARTPSFLLQLPESGTKSDYLQIASSHADPSPALSNTLHNVPLVQAIHVKTQATIFWIIPCTYMSDIQDSIEEWENKIKTAGAAIQQSTEASLECMRKFVDTLKKALNGWKPPLLPKPEPEPAPAQMPVQNLMTYMASFIPETPQAAPAPDSVPAAKPWYQIW